MVLLSPRLGGGAPHTPSVVYSAEHEHDGSKNKIIKGGVGSARLLVPCWPRFAMGQPSGAARVVYIGHKAVLETARGGGEGAAPSHPHTPNCCQHPPGAAPRGHHGHLPGSRRAAPGLRRPPPPRAPSPGGSPLRLASPQPGLGPRWRLRSGHMSPSTAAVAVRPSVFLPVCLPVCPVPPLPSLFPCLLGGSGSDAAAAKMAAGGL